MPHQPSNKDGLSPEEAPSPLDAERLPSRRFLHVTLALMLAVPAAVWMLRSPTDTEGEVLGGAEIDEAAPDFTLDLFNGGVFALTDHLNQDGRPVVMNLWASWCVPCREEMPAFDAVARRTPEVLVLGVAVQDTETAAREFAAEVAVSYPLGLDADGAILEMYPILGLPATWFITSEGHIAARWMGQLDEDHLEGLIEEHLTR